MLSLERSLNQNEMMSIKKEETDFVEIETKFKIEIVTTNIDGILMLKIDFSNVFACARIFHFGKQNKYK